MGSRDSLDMAEKRKNPVLPEIEPVASNVHRTWEVKVFILFN